jgi:hypothetical protein
MKQFFKLNRITFQRLYEDAQSWFESVYNLTRDQFTPASPWGQLLGTLLNLAQMIFYYIEDSITELNINTASRRESIIGIASMNGHSATRSTGSRGDIILEYSGQNVDMYGQSIIIPNYTKLFCLNNGQSYILDLNQEDLRVNITNTERIKAKIIQGTWENQTFTGTGEILQSFEVNVRGRKEIDDNYVFVYVNGELYPKYESLYDIPLGRAGCLIRTGITSGVDVFFGTEFNGKVPPSGATIRVEYLITNGSLGNILSNISETVFRWDETGYDVTGKEIDLNSALNTSLSTPLIFGTDHEPIELTRLIAPKMSRSFVLANAENYSIFLQKMNYFSIVECFSTFDDNVEEDDNVIYIFAIPDILKRVRNNEDYFTIPQEQFILTDTEKNSIYRLLQESGQMIVTTAVKVLDPVIVRYVLNISIIVYEGYDIETIREKIVERTAQYFLNNKRRDRIPKSDLVAIIEAIDGVDSVDLYFVNEGNELRKYNWLEELKTNSTAIEPDDIGLDEHGNILIGKSEYPILRGGWSDRNQVFFQDNADLNVTSSVNIDVSRITPKTVNLELHSTGIRNLKGLK